MPELVLGPMVRHVSERTASIWVETSARATVTVRTADQSWSASTFVVHDHHFALVRVTGLEPGSMLDYTVDLDGDAVWPDPDSSYPASRIMTLDRERPTRLMYGSCRTSVPHDDEHHRSHGVDALRSLAIHLTKDRDASERPDLLVFLGDQVYADETSPAMQEFIESRRSLEEPPGEELKDFEEYAHLYGLAWSEPANRWLMSTVPSVMIFDDHDIRDDWNTSYTWHQEMNATSWWHERLLGGLTSYWVYQHLGNLSPDELAADEIWQRVVTHEESGATDELDLTEALRALSAAVDQHPERYRFSYAVDLGDARLVMIDSRAARELEPDKRNMLDATELEWLDGQLTGDVDHLLIGTSLPFLLPPGLHHVEAWNEQVAEGNYGARWKRIGETLRQKVDLEHWAAFEHGFDQVSDMVLATARGERGRAPATVTFLSGDVHNSFVNRVDEPEELGLTSHIVQAVCSPIRNPLPRAVRVMMAALAHVLARPMDALVSRARRVPSPPFTWTITNGPWFDNNVGLLRVEGDKLHLTWHTGEVKGRAANDPILREVANVQID
ncbi:alkaline phosphatase D family protein [Demetria terragena]|uniref:alkaline phosphatase D family protein n=1 Tax=Demetria terragena TaxID=63959 RepID=UPI00037626E8|nr:alkaline phosphatase D family protein [Demetria terragena]